MLIDNSKVQDLVAYYIYERNDTLNKDRDLYIVNFMNKFRYSGRFVEITAEYHRVKNLFYSRDKISEGIKDNDELDDIITWLEAKRIINTFIDLNNQIEFTKNYIKENRL